MLMNIKTMDTEHSINFLSDRFAKDNIDILRNTAIYLIKKVGSIPYYIQFVAAEIWQQIINNKQKITNYHVDKALEHIIDLKSDYYWELTNKQTNYRKKVLYAISKSVEELFSKKTTNDYNLGPVSTTQKAVKSFINEGIIERFNNQYKFSDPIYKLFLIKNL